MRNIIFIALAGIFVSTPATTQSSGFVAVCNSIAGQRYDFARHPLDWPGGPGEIYNEWGPDNYANPFSFSYNGNELRTDTGMATILHEGPRGEIIAYELSSGRSPAANLYTYAIYPELRKVVMNKMQTQAGVLASAVMGATYEMDCKFGSLSTD